MLRQSHSVTPRLSTQAFGVRLVDLDVSSAASVPCQLAQGIVGTGRGGPAHYSENRLSLIRSWNRARKRWDLAGRAMKKQFILGASFVAAVPSMAAAAPPAPVSPLYHNWAGPYLGIAGAYGWGHSDHTDGGIPCALFGNCGTTLIAPTTGSGAGSFSTAGGLYGGFAGYNWQILQWVYGLEIDYAGGHITGSSNNCGANTSFPHSCGTDLDSFGTLRGRIGYSISNWLLYVTGGWAFGQIKAWDNLFPASGHDSPTGLTFGGGIQGVLIQNWSFKIEYLYVDFGNHQFFAVVPTIGETTRLTTNIFRIGIVYSPYP